MFSHLSVQKNPSFAGFLRDNEIESELASRGHQKWGYHADQNAGDRQDSKNFVDLFLTFGVVHCSVPVTGLVLLKVSSTFWLSDTSSVT